MAEVGRGTLGPSAPAFAPAEQGAQHHIRWLYRISMNEIPAP